MTKNFNMIEITSNNLSQTCVYLQHASCPLLLEALQERPDQVIHIEQLELCLDDGLQCL